MHVLAKKARPILVVHFSFPFSLLLPPKWPKINKLKTTPTPNKNGSYGVKGGFACHIFGVRMPFFCRNPLILTDFYAIQTPIVWHIFGAYFLPIWGVGVVRIIFKKGKTREPPNVGLAPAPLWRVPPTPSLQLEDPSFKPQPFPSPPSPSLFPPIPLALSATLGKGRARLVWGSPRARGGGG